MGHGKRARASLSCQDWVWVEVKLRTSLKTFCTFFEWKIADPSLTQSFSYSWFLKCFTYCCLHHEDDKVRHDTTADMLWSNVLYSLRTFYCIMSDSCNITCVFKRFRNVKCCQMLLLIVKSAEQCLLWSPAIWRQYLLLQSFHKYCFITFMRMQATCIVGSW